MGGVGIFGDILGIFSGSRGGRCVVFFKASFSLYTNYLLQVVDGLLALEGEIHLQYTDNKNFRRGKDRQARISRESEPREPTLAMF